MAWKAKMEELMTQPGVVHHGRVSQQELINFKATAPVHFYPCIFEEIDCIGVRESAAVECIPVTTNYAALKDRTYCWTVPGNPLKIETQKNVADKVVLLLTTAFEGSEGFSVLAREESWKNIADRWAEHL